MLTGRNGSEVENRRPNGASTSSMNSRLFAYAREATEWPSIRQVIFGAKESVTGVPSCRHASNAAVIAARLRSVSSGVGMRAWAFSGQPGRDQEVAHAEARLVSRQCWRPIRVDCQVGLGVA